MSIEIVQSMANGIFSSGPLHINFRKQIVKCHRHTVCVIHTKDRVLLDSSDCACERPLYSTEDSTEDSTECGNGWKGALEDMYNILLVRSDNHLKDLIKKKEDDDKIRDEEEKARKEAVEKRASLLRQGDSW